MNSITFVLYFTVLSRAFAQQTDLKQQVLAAMDNRGISETLREMDEECRSITRELLGSCIAEIYPDYTMEQIQFYLFTTNIFGDFALNLAEFGPGISNVFLYPDRTLKRKGGCCQLNCQITKHGCSCGEGNVDGLGRVFDNGGFIHAPFEFLTEMMRICIHEKINFSYSIRYPEYFGCFEGSNERYYRQTDCS